MNTKLQKMDTELQKFIIRTVADSLDELMNGNGAIRDMIAAKLDKNAKVANAANADHATTADTASSAGTAATATTATTATSAGKVTGGTVQLTGAITGSASFNSSGNVSIATSNNTISGGDATQTWVTNNFYKKTDTVANATNAVNATNATKATQDGDGKTISTIYAKKTDIPDTSGLLTKSQADGYYLGKTAFGKLVVGNGTLSFSDNPNIEIKFASNRLTLDMSSGSLVSYLALYSTGREPELVIGSATYQFKTDGIYLNNTKITN